MGLSYLQRAANQLLWRRCARLIDDIPNNRQKSFVANLSKTSDFGNIPPVAYVPLDSEGLVDADET